MKFFIQWRFSFVEAFRSAKLFLRKAFISKAFSNKAFLKQSFSSFHQRFYDKNFIKQCFYFTYLEIFFKKALIKKKVWICFRLKYIFCESFDLINNSYCKIINQKNLSPIFSPSKLHSFSLNCPKTHMK